MAVGKHRSYTKMAPKREEQGSIAPARTRVWTMKVYSASLPSRVSTSAAHRHDQYIMSDLAMLRIGVTSNMSDPFSVL